MADNTVLNAGTGGDAVRTVDKVGTKTQVVTLDLGGSGAESLVAGSIPVTGTFWQATQPVSGTFWQATQPVSGPLTDAQLRAVAVPVSGTFYQATQPVSIAAAVGVTDNAGSLTVDSTQLPAALAAGGGLKVEGVAGGVAVPVSGTFWQATQPVSGTVAVSNASFPVTDNAGSLTVDAPVATPVFVRLSDGAAAIATLPVSLASLPALATGANVIGAVTQSGTWTVTQQTLTKGTQGATGVTTQNLKDAGRSARSIFLDSFAVAATTETLMTMSFSSDNGTPTTGTSYTVTAGKRLRIQCISAGLHTIAGNTTAVNVIVRIRTIATAPALVGSPIQFVLPIQGIAAANQAGMPVFVDFPDGWELPAGAGLGVTVTCSGFVATTAAPKVDITINAYEY